MAEVNANEESFQKEVIEAELPVLVDFSAEWCGPCKMVDPIVHELSEDWAGKVKVVKVDADESPSILMQYGVMGIPTLMFFVNGEVKERVTGYQPKKKLVKKFEKHI
ncbi:MAG: thioredoxin [Anaerolineae bacterium]|jgi:thioredoxin 1|nr:thioredoxin [Anaerolineae bacterium]MBT7070965.1 thioredoxin [Anaerolineae bacterium]MBT7325871.1 thioredoxin [Anaerolineae bacterium]